MAIDTSQFSEVSEFGPVSKLERTVDTPMPENEDGSGYTTEENRQVIYEVGEHLFKVSKVSTRGWTVTHYESGEIEDIHMGYEDTASKAHLIARTMVEEVLADE